MAEKKYSLKKLFRRFIVGISLALLGSWLLSAFKFNYVLEAFSLGESKEVLLLLDYIFLIIALLGLFISLAVLPELMARINRVDILGEKRW
ncbi:MAG: hypothetical protein JRG97_12255 [Deltaproteobacteria bacterium]|nr:hypothetical protein [Deltaproteobacteria bacterium]MBW2141822.1 hypothetical protein [Deltaproteobacteria bacterium]